MLSEGRTNTQQIRETSQGFLVSNASCRTVATNANWPTHRKAAMRSDNSIPNLNIVEMPMPKRTKAREIATFIHVSSLLLVAIGESPSYFCMNVRIRNCKETWNFVQQLWDYLFFSNENVSRMFRSSAPPLLPSCSVPYAFNDLALPSRFPKQGNLGSKNWVELLALSSLRY